MLRSLKPDTEPKQVLCRSDCVVVALRERGTRISPLDGKVWEREGSKGPRGRNQTRVAAESPGPEWYALQPH